MQHTNIEFKKIYERDIDLLIIEEFMSDRGFSRLFLDKLQMSDNYSLCKVSHSLSDANGESDITFILQYPDKKIALLLEDKIDAVTMPSQSQRYHKRAENAILRRDYDSYYVMLSAPTAYLHEHADDCNADYEYKVSYEELRDYLNKRNDVRAVFKASMLDFAIKEHKNGYQVQEAPAVTEFWRRLRQFCKENYPQLVMVGEDGPKGSTAVWPEFRTSLGTIKVIYKSQKGFVDLEFPKYGNNIATLLSKVRSKMSDSMQILKTGRSASIRISNEAWKVDFSNNFDEYKNQISEVLQAVKVLCELASLLNYSELY